MARFVWHRSLMLGVSLLAAMAVSAVASSQTTATEPPDPAKTAVTAEQREDILKALEGVVLNRAFVPGVDLSKWPEYLAKHREALDKTETQTTFAGEVNRTLREFGISHMRLATPRAAKARTQRSATGAGVNVRPTPEGLEVASVNPTGPAASAGLEAGDVILEVNGAKPDSTELLNGPEDTKIALKVRKKDGTIKDLEITRKTYSTVRPETLTWIDDETAVLKVFTFNVGYGRENIEKLMEEAKTKAKYLILDVRSNGGGSTNNMNHLLSLLLPEGSEYGTFVNRRMAQNFSEANKKDANDAVEIAKWTTIRQRTRKLAVTPFTGKIAVLINRGTGSASEIVTAACREVLSAPVVGSRSAGAVLASTYAQLPEGFQLQYPVSDYVTIKGIRLEGNPIIPDEEVTGRAEEGKTEPAVLKAIELMKKAS